MALRYFVCIDRVLQADIFLGDDINGLLQKIYKFLCFDVSVFRCWSLKFKQSDHQFLHQSNVFHHINNILSKSDDGDSEESFNISVQSGYEAISQVGIFSSLLANNIDLLSCRTH